MASGLAELGPKLGPIVWQFATTKVFDPADFEAFLKLLPPTLDGLTLRHAVEVRHPSFMTARVPGAGAPARRRHRLRRLGQVPVVRRRQRRLRLCPADDDRVEAQDGLRAGEDRFWADAARRWAQGESVDALPRLEAKPARTKPRDVFAFFISGAKERAPGAATALMAELGFAPLPLP
jgi:uncharacterized protein YecE (DUF72 family)